MARSDYRVLYWCGDMDGPWSDMGKERYLDRECNGLVLVPGGDWIPDDLRFIHDLPNLQYFSLERKIKRDVEVFHVDTLEELSLVTGSRLSVPEGNWPNLIRLALTDRDGINVAGRWPNLQELRLGRWRGSDLRMLEGATSIKYLHLEGRHQIATLGGIESCNNLNTLEVIQVAFDDLGPLSSLNNLQELKLMASPRSRHEMIDFSLLHSSALERVWVSNASEMINISHLARSRFLREVRLIDCGVRDVRELKDQFPSWVRVDVF